MSQIESETSTGAAEAVLVVDDEVLVRMVIATYLRDCGYRVIEAASPDEAKLVIEHDDEGAISIVLSGVAMPAQGDGFELAQGALIDIVFRRFVFVDVSNLKHWK